MGEIYVGMGRAVGGSENLAVLPPQRQGPEEHHVGRQQRALGV